jgi:hypothetical protein
MRSRIPPMLDEGLGDARLQSIHWIDNDLLLTFVQAGTGAVLRFQFVWATGLVMDLDFGAYIGMGMLWHNDVTGLSSGEMVVKLDFGGAPRGVIEFKCSEIVQLTDSD